MPVERGIVVGMLGVTTQSAGVLQKLPQREAAAGHQAVEIEPAARDQHQHEAERQVLVMLHHGTSTEWSP